MHQLTLVVVLDPVHDGVRGRTKLFSIVNNPIIHLNLFKNVC